MSNDRSKTSQQPQTSLRKAATASNAAKCCSSAGSVYGRGRSSGAVLTNPAWARAAAARVNADEARKIAKDAYIFSFPLNCYYRTIYSQIVDSNNENSLGGFGKWRHDGLAQPEDKETTMPNNDTPYSWAWVDVRSEPWVLVQPPADGDRFYSSVWGDLWASHHWLSRVRQRGTGGGTYLFAPVSWKGEKPEGVDRVIYGETTILGTLTRTAVFGPDDLPNTQKIQQGYKLMPLSAYLKQPAPLAAPEPDWPVWNEADMTNADFFRLTNFLMQFVVPNELDKLMYEEMTKLGIGPDGDYDPAKFPPDILAAINRELLKATRRLLMGLPSPSIRASFTARANSWGRDTWTAPSA